MPQLLLAGVTIDAFLFLGLWVMWHISRWYACCSFPEENVIISGVSGTYTTLGLEFGLGIRPLETPSVV